MSHRCHESNRERLRPYYYPGPAGRTWRKVRIESWSPRGRLRRRLAAPKRRCGRRQWVHIVTASDYRKVRLWDATTGAEIVVLRGHENSRERHLRARWGKSAGSWRRWRQPASRARHSVPSPAIGGSIALHRDEPGRASGRGLHARSNRCRKASGKFQREGPAAGSAGKPCRVTFERWARTPLVLRVGACPWDARSRDPDP